MKKLRQRIAAALIVVMTAGMMVVPSQAQEAPKHSWQLVDGEWYYYDGAGEMVQSREKYINGNWYGFDDDGKMYSDEMFEGRKNGGSPLYAYPIGNLAKGWVQLTESGNLVTSADDDRNSSWYYFKGGSNQNDPIKMVYDTEKTINHNKYRFHEDGTMYSAEWYTGDPTDSEESVTVSYYQKDGVKAVSKWLPLEDFWYHYNSSGKVTEIAPIASPSDATPVVQATMSNATPARQVSQIVASPSDASVETSIGEPVSLNFHVTLASDSNAVQKGYTDFMNYHDFGPGSFISGSFKVTGVTTDGLCTVQFTPKKLGTAQISLRIDGETSDPIEVTTIVKDTEDKSSVVNNLIDSLVDSGAEGGVLSADTRKDILSILEKSNDTEKKDIQNSIVKNGNYEILENTYITENRIDVRPVNVTEDAKALLGNGTVSMVGGALNAEAGEPVELKVSAIDAPELKQEFKNKIAFDIKLEINETEESDLNFPVKISMPVPAGFKADTMKLFHIHDQNETEVDFTVNGDLIEFTTSGFSAFVFAQNETIDNNNNNNNNDINNGNSSSSGGGGSSSSNSINSSAANGIVTTDSKKGKVNSLTGIIIGSGDGYSKWIPVTSPDADGEILWKLQYADGTYAAGSYLLDEQGNPRKDTAGNLIEQPCWELIEGAWYAFGADSYAKSGLLFDPAYNGWFYIDINTGMKTGWLQLDGKWYYFNASSDGSKGIMFVNRTTPDGYTVDTEGVWNGQ